MAAETPENADSKIAADEEWKAHVRAENEALERASRLEAAATAASPADRSKSIPPAPERLPSADFGSLVTMFSTQAMVSLGMIPHPASGKPEVQLPLARHFIDLLGVVEAKTTGNLDRREVEMLSSTLHFLRMSYVEQTRKP